MTIDGAGLVAVEESQDAAPLVAPPVTVTLTVDGECYRAEVDPTLASLRVIRDVLGHERPRIGCEEGRCGKCESIVNGAETRLCITPIGTLDGAVIVTPVPRRSIFG